MAKTDVGAASEAGTAQKVADAGRSATDYAKREVEGSQTAAAPAHFLPISTHMRFYFCLFGNAR